MQSAIKVFDCFGFEQCNIDKYTITPTGNPNTVYLVS